MAYDNLNAVVTQRIEVSPGLLVLRVAPVGWKLPEFNAGQFAVLGLPSSARRFAFSDAEDNGGPSDGLIKRAYSIASSSVSREYLEFYVVLVRSGALTPRLFALEKGDRLWLGGKYSGLFTLDDVADEKHVVLIGTGTGLAPYMSMLRTHLVCGGKRHFAVLHGARHSWDLGYRSELETLDRMCPNFSYLPSISRPQEEDVPWGGAAGYIQDVWGRKPLRKDWGFQPGPEDADVFVCGNPEMAESMIRVLAKEGFREHAKQQPGQVHIERYW
jgi:ferredoxin--NADP+ reductase